MSLAVIKCKKYKECFILIPAPPAPEPWPTEESLTPRCRQPGWWTSVGGLWGGPEPREGGPEVPRAVMRNDPDLLGYRPPWSDKVLFPFSEIRTWRGESGGRWEFLDVFYTGMDCLLWYALVVMFILLALIMSLYMLKMLLFPGSPKFCVYL